MGSRVCLALRCGRLHSTGATLAETATSLDVWRTRLQSDLKGAMRERDSRRTTVLKSLLADLIYHQKATGQTGELHPAVLVQRAIQKRVDAIQAFQKANCPDRAAEEQEQLDLIRAYLPRQLTEQELAAVARTVVKEVQAQSGRPLTGRDMGAVMRILKQRVDPGQATASALAAAAKQLLASK